MPGALGKSGPQKCRKDQSRPLAAVHGGRSCSLPLVLVLSFSCLVTIHSSLSAKPPSHHEGLHVLKENRLRSVRAQWSSYCSSWRWLDIVSSINGKSGIDCKLVNSFSGPWNAIASDWSPRLPWDCRRSKHTDVMSSMPCLDFASSILVPSICGHFGHFCKHRWLSRAPGL